MGDSKHTALPPNWQVGISSQYNIEYYFNKVTGESQWTPPTSTQEGSTRESEAKPMRMRASHILAKHVESRRPSSWREANITRTKEEAVQKVTELRQIIEAGDAQFAEVASAESDCSSAKNGGDLRWFERGKMQPAFEEAVLALKVGEMSQPVFSDSGVHIILRTG
ncbi:peptidyl-prolyl cis-trans isomerase Pin1 [Coemansia sp. Benny D115]|nr:peptidyl-prolyl cis-trans isomerase Pin1 [Coemansia sp. Benny D115]